MYDKRKIELVDSEAISFIFEGVNEEQDEYYDTTRDVLFCKLKYNDELLNVFVAHLPSKREKDVNKPKRDYILHSIKERVLTLLEKEEPLKTTQPHHKPKQKYTPTTNGENFLF